MMLVIFFTNEIVTFGRQSYQQAVGIPKLYIVIILLALFTQGVIVHPFIIRCYSVINKCNTTFHDNVSAIKNNPRTTH